MGAAARGTRGQMSDERAHTFIEALRRLEADGDADALVELFAEDSECDNVTPSDPYRGKDGAREFWQQDRALFADVKSEFKNVIVRDDRVALEWTRTGSARDGDPIELEGVSLLELEDGRIRRFKAYFDPHQVGRQVA
jgi:steroid delta-isomerase-like uncharacterized protein